MTSLDLLRFDRLGTEENAEEFVRLHVPKGDRTVPAMKRKRGAVKPYIVCSRRRD